MSGPSPRGQEDVVSAEIQEETKQTDEQQMADPSDEDSFKRSLKIAGLVDDARHRINAIKLSLDALAILVTRDGYKHLDIVGKSLSRIQRQVNELCQDDDYLPLWMQ